MKNRKGYRRSSCAIKDAEGKERFLEVNKNFEINKSNDKSQDNYDPSPGQVIPLLL